VALGAGDARFAFDEGCFLSVRELSAQSKDELRHRNVRKSDRWTAQFVLQESWCRERCSQDGRAGATHMAFVETADKTASLLLLLGFRRHRGGYVDRELFGLLICSSVKQNTIRRVEVLAKSNLNALTKFGCFRASTKVALSCNLLYKTGSRQLQPEARTMVLSSRPVQIPNLGFTRLKP
jgi:hypothetical protein